MAFTYKRGGRRDYRPLVLSPTAGAVSTSSTYDVLDFSDAGHTSAVTWLGTLAITGDFTVGLSVITNVSITTGYSAGATIASAYLPLGTTVSSIDPVLGTLTVSNPATATVTTAAITITDPALSVGGAPNGTWSWDLNLFTDWNWPTYYTFSGGLLNSATVTAAIQVLDGSSTILTQASCSASFTVDNSNALTTNMQYTISLPTFGAELLPTFNGVRFVWTNSNTALAGILAGAHAGFIFKIGTLISV